MLKNLNLRASIIHRRESGFPNTIFLSPTRWLALDLNIIFFGKFM